MTGASGYQLIRERREAQDIRQQQLADKIGMSQQHLDNLEKGKRTVTLKWARKLAEALGGDAIDYWAGDSTLPPEHAELLGYFARLDEGDRQRLLRISQALAEAAEANEIPVAARKRA